MSENRDPSSRAIILIGLVVLGLLIAGGLVVWGVSHGFGPRNSEQQEQTYAQDATRIEIDSNSGDVKIHAGADNEVRVDRTLVWYTDRPNVDESWDGTTFRVRNGCPGNCHIDYDITVPADVSVMVKSDSGDVEVSGVTGAVDMDADSGNLKVDNLSGQLTLHMDSGDLEGTRISSPQVEVSASSGNADLRFSTAPSKVTVSLDSGSLDLKVPTSPDGYAVDIKSDSGDIDTGEVTINDASTHVIHADMDSGDVTVSTT